MVTDSRIAHWEPSVKFWANSVIWKNFKHHSLFLRKRYNDAADNFLLVRKGFWKLPDGGNPMRSSSAVELVADPVHSHSISLKLRDLNQLFNSMDPSPFIEKDLDDRAEEFIVGWAQEFPPDAHVRLRVHLTCIRCEYATVCRPFCPPINRNSSYRHFILLSYTPLLRPFFSSLLM